MINEIGLTQCQKILNMMYENRNEKKVWYAKDFQRGKYFVGYEASARMSELAKMYPDLIIIGKNGRFRTLSINWDYENIQEYISKYIYNNYEDKIHIGFSIDGISTEKSVIF